MDTTLLPSVLSTIPTRITIAIRAAKEGSE